ncbi:HAD-IA family hydrolase [Pullulanibacillus sp. KACC 23026]|uniref:HAD-IA family hydrolase n=1 Tax=Pullulanibacillus sp. KACC 23026 TaxID=3028315 RepID=UPI0023B1AEAF|nr:HAD-IA family hydrolase [Pullulanibacillus sp. KACC 23026]WEG13530.1 HAD-IA family hydrolase [Pullulanibacillus sp. KACC 23026]
MYKHIIWDFDGTLFDAYPVMGKAFQVTLRGRGIEEPLDAIMKQMRVSMGHALKHYETKYHIDSAFIEDYEKQRKDRELAYIKPYEGIEELCRFIHTSGRHNYLFTHRGESAITFLKKFGLYNYFTDCITSEHGFERKPSPAGIEFLMEKYKMKHSESIMIGDRDLDVLSGKNAGISGCFFTESHESSSHADYTIHEFQQLYPIL